MARARIECEIRNAEAFDPELAHLLRAKDAAENAVIEYCKARTEAA